MYDNNSTSYKDHSLENPDAILRICADSSSELLGKYVSLVYADGSNPGDYLLVVHGPGRGGSVDPSNCAYLPLEISSFKAWYPSIPYVFISSSLAIDSSTTRIKLSRTTGWFIGNYSISVSQTGSQVNITVINATDDNGDLIVSDVDYLVVGLDRDDMTTMDTAITSINNSVILNADSPTATYHIFINGIGPDLAPYVHIISPADGTTYSSGSITFTYSIVDDDGVDSCWYVLDGNSYTMPSCGPSYLLSVSAGSHTLTLYANDTSGKVGHDTVSFTVSGSEGGTTGGTTGTSGGGVGIGNIFYPPPTPSQISPNFNINPYDIHIYVYYPENGEANFTVYSNVDTSDLYCYVDSEFSRYIGIDIDDSIPTDSSISGRIYTTMSPSEILEYNGSTVGSLVCVGNLSGSLIGSVSANVYLHIFRPALKSGNRTIKIQNKSVFAENRTLYLHEGMLINDSINVTNLGRNTSTVNLSVVFLGEYKNWVKKYSLTRTLPPKSSTKLNYVLGVPFGTKEGTYLIPYIIYENGVPLSKGRIRVIISLLPKCPALCSFPDLSAYSFLLLLVVLLPVLFYALKSKKEKEEPSWDYYLKRDRNIIYSIIVGLAGLFFWSAIIHSFAHCSFYAPEGVDPSVLSNPEVCLLVHYVEFPIFTLLILIGGVLLSIVYFFDLSSKGQGMKIYSPELKRAVKYLVLINLSALALFLVSLYLFLGYPEFLV